MIFCLWLEWQIFQLADKINKLPEKIGSMQVPITNHKQKNTWSKEDVHTSAWDLKRQYNVCNFVLKAQTLWSLEWRERPAGLSSRSVCSSYVFSGRRPTSPRHRRKICANSLWMYSYEIQSPSSKNKNINYISIYQRVFRCLCSGSICDTATTWKRWEKGAI